MPDILPFGKTFVDWFSGIGGIRTALEACGWRCVHEVEIDEFCRSIHRERFGHEPRGSDILAVDASEIPDSTLWAGGPPCQDLSVAGLRRGLSGKRSGLFHRLVELARIKRPGYILLEQVPGLLSSHEGRDMEAWVGALAELGYVGTWFCVNAEFEGVPQRRRRIFTCGALGNPRVAQVSPIFEGRPRDPAPRGKKGPNDSADIARSVKTHGRGKHDASHDTYVKADGERPAAAITSSLGHHGHSSPRGDAMDHLAVSPTLRSHPRPGSNCDSSLLASSEVGHAVSKSSGGGLGGRDGQDDYVIQTEAPPATAFHRNASCSVTDQCGKAAPLKSEGEHSYQFVAQPDGGEAAVVPPLTTKSGGMEKGWAPVTEADHLVVAGEVAAPLTSGSHPNSNAPGRKKEDDENLVIVPQEPPREAVAFDSHNTPKRKSGTLTGGERGGGKNEINLPLVAEIPASEVPRQADEGSPDDAQLELFGPADAGPAPARGGGTEVVRIGNASSHPHVKTPGVTDALGTGSGHGAGYSDQAVFSVSNTSDPITARDVAQPVISRKGDPGSVGIPSAANIHGGGRRADRPDGGMYVEEGADKAKAVSATGASPTSPQGGTVVFQPRYLTRGGKCGGKPSDSAEITNANKAGDSSSHVVVPSVPPRQRECPDQVMAVLEDNQNGVQMTDKAGSLRAGAPGSQPGGSLMAFQESQSGVRESKTHATIDANFGSRRHEGVVQEVPEPLTLQGFMDMLVNYADGTKAGPVEILRLLQEASSSEEGARRGSGILAPFRTAKILRPDLHVEGIRPEADKARLHSEHGPLSCQKDEEARDMRKMSQETGHGCPSQGRESSAQCTTQPRESLPQLPSEGTQREQAKTVLRDLWQTEQGARLLREALSALEEVGRSSDVQNKPAHAAGENAGLRRPATGVGAAPMTVRRLTPT